MDRLPAFSDQLATAVQRAATAIVAVHGRRRVPSTGIHWKSGLIVTANHAVQTDDDVTVTIANARSAPATVVDRDFPTDIAVLRIDAADLAVAEIGDSDAVRVGHMVLAVGTGPRASWGVVSAIGAARSRRWDTEVFSLDLTLYPGFSGGPLVDTSGAVVGLTTSGASQHMQLAIPAKTVGGIVEAVARHGRIPRAYLGVSTQQVRLPEGYREAAGQDRRTALIVVEVQAASPASAGLLVGDIILSVAGTPVSDPLELRALLRPDRIGERITTAVIRAGRLLDVELTVGERPASSR